MTITTDPTRDELLTDFGKATLTDRYLLPGEGYQDLFARVSKAYQDDDAHGQRIYDYMSRHWFLPATPVLSNGGAGRGLPISCFVNELGDSIDGIADTFKENVHLASSGGGIGCVDSETEFLTKSGWKKISDYDGEEIFVVSEDGARGFFEKPLDYISGPCGKMYHLSNGTTDMVVSENHRNFVRFDGKSNFYCKTTAHLLEKPRRVHTARFKAFTRSEGGEGLPYTEMEIRFLVALAADGYQMPNHCDAVRFAFRRQRKIDRMFWLCEQLDLKPDFDSDGNTATFIFRNYGLTKKALTFENFGAASSGQLDIIFNEMGHWDGSFDQRTSNMAFYTSKKEEGDFAQYVIMHATQRRSGLGCNARMEYKVTQTYDEHSMVANVEEFFPEDGQQYCFRTTTGLWFSRRSGSIIVTGNSYFGNLRALGEKVGKNHATSGVIPFMKMLDSQTMAISQSGIRRGSAAAYLPVWHPESAEFIEIRKPTGGDPNRRCLNLHHGILVDDKFMEAVEKGEEYALISPKTGKTVKKVDARTLWVSILTTRIEQGEPYIIFLDNVNNSVPEVYKRNGLTTKTSQLCSEIHLHTGIDYLGNDRSAVCCLSSLNLENWDEWKDDPQFIEDVMRFLDNVLQDFIDRAPDSMARARYAAMRERSVGLGAMGFHSFLQARSIPFESVMAKVWNKKFFKHIREQADAASVKLAHEKGACPDAIDAGIMERFTHKMAVAPTASISIIAGCTSPGIEPISANVFLQKTLSGSFTVRNRHLKQVLAAHGQDTKATWRSITLNKGSVQHLDFLTQDEKDVYKTAFELDQRWVVEHAADRAPHIDQGQSVNLFLPADVHKKDLHAIHFMAWKKGVKSLYYCRSLSIQRAENVSDAVGVAADNVRPRTEPDECLACQ